MKTVSTVRVTPLIISDMFDLHGSRIDVEACEVVTSTSKLVVGNLN